MDPLRSHLFADAGLSEKEHVDVAARDHVDEPVDVGGQLSLGLHSAEQLWFVTTGDTNPVIRRVSEELDAPRRAWSRLGEAF